MSSAAPSPEAFARLGLSSALARSVSAHGFVAPTAVQREAIPAVLSGRDVWASAETGSGKTAAFVLPLLERFTAAPVDPSGPRSLRALILTPTRELALQIAEVVEALGRPLPRRPKTVSAVGGVSIEPQRMALRGGADFLVATPGRLLELSRSGGLSFEGLGTLVLDEADRLLSGAFADELAEVLALMPPIHQSLLFSATMPTAVRDLARSFLVNPVAVNVSAGALPADGVIVQRAIEVDKMLRTPLLRALLATLEDARVLVFVASKHAAEHVAAKLQKTGISAAALHGDLTQSARNAALSDLKDGRVRVLVATDLAARGVDIEGLGVVVNYDLPRGAVDYLHRVGRTGRAGAQGLAISFLTEESSAHFDVIASKHGLSLEREQVPGFEPRREPISPRDPNGGVKGRRKSKKDKLREAAALAELAERGERDAPSD